MTYIRYFFIQNNARRILTTVVSRVLINSVAGIQDGEASPLFAFLRLEHMFMDMLLFTRFLQIYVVHVVCKISPVRGATPRDAYASRLVNTARVSAFALTLEEYCATVPELSIHGFTKQNP